MLEAHVSALDAFTESTTLNQGVAVEDDVSVFIFDLLLELMQRFEVFSMYIVKGRGDDVKIQLHICRRETRCDPTAELKSHFGEPPIADWALTVWPLWM